jgi:RNA polymerase sigma-70 factor (ECF subfamily)
MMETHQGTETLMTGYQDDSTAARTSSTLVFFKTRTRHQTDRRRAVPSGPDQDDFLLMRQVAARDPQAFETIYLRYVRRVHGYLSKFLRQPELVEEVLDDVMLVVWQNAIDFNNTSRLSTWILGIAYYKAIKALAKTSPPPIALSPTLLETQDDHADPEMLIAREEIKRLLAHAIDLLPPTQRIVIELTFQHNCSYPEIATRLGCSVNTVKSRMFHARQRLARCLTGRHPLLFPPPRIRASA